MRASLRSRGRAMCLIVLDLLGRRADAVAHYEEALKIPGSPSWQHSQYNLTINKQWVQERLKTPFERR